MFDLPRKKIISGLRSAYMHRLPFFSDAIFENSGQVILYPQVQLAYNRIKKAANSSTMMFLSESLVANGFIQDVSENENNYHQIKHNSIQYGVSLSKIWQPKDIRRLPDFFWFTVVRNPYSRLLSAFLQKGQGALRGSPVYKGIPGFDQLNSTGFREFVHYLDNGGLYSNQHWWPQLKLLFIPLGRFDYIARTESLEQDLNYVFQQAGLISPCKITLSKPHVAELSADWKVTNANSRLSEFYDEHTRNIVYKLYKDDFINLGYEYEHF